jgi:hypothetical protein
MEAVVFALPENRRQTALQAGGRGQGRQVVVSMGKFFLQKIIEPEPGLVLFWTVDLQPAGVAGCGVAGYQGQNTLGIGLALIAVVAEADPGSELSANFLQQASRPGMQAVRQRKDDVNFLHAWRRFFIWPNC